jgi:hypothetical protein
MSPRIRRVPVRLLVSAALCAAVAFSGSNASAHEDDCKPEFEWDYTEEELAVTATFDLSDCWGDKPFVGKTRIWRADQTASPLAIPPSERSRWRCPVTKSRTCRVDVAIEHPDVEIADYQLDLDFFRRNGKRASYGLLLPGCVSAGVAYSECGH